MRMLIDRLKKAGHIVERRGGTFDLIVDGRPAEVKTEGTRFEELDFISLTDYQWGAASPYYSRTVCKARFLLVLVDLKQLVRPRTKIGGALCLRRCRGGEKQAYSDDSPSIFSWRRTVADAIFGRKKRLSAQRAETEGNLTEALDKRKRDR